MHVAFRLPQEHYIESYIERVFTTKQLYPSPKSLNAIKSDQISPVMFGAKEFNNSRDMQSYR